MNIWLILSRFSEDRDKKEKEADGKEWTKSRSDQKEEEEDSASLYTSLIISFDDLDLVILISWAGEI